MKKVRVRVSMLLDVELPEGVEVNDLSTPDIVTVFSHGNDDVVQQYVDGSDRIEEVEPHVQW